MENEKGLVSMQERDTIMGLVRSGSQDGNFRAYKTFFQGYSAGLKKIVAKLEILEEDFRAKYDYNPIHNMESRIKNPQSIAEKMRRRDIPMRLDEIKRNITDIAGVRVVCNYISDIYRIEDLLLAQEDIRLIARKDYIENPKTSGYRSLHLIVAVPVDFSERREEAIVEIQLRTIAMDFWASLEHHMRYKSPESGDNAELARELHECAEDAARLDNKMLSIFNKIKQTGN